MNSISTNNPLWGYLAIACLLIFFLVMLEVVVIKKKDIKIFFELTDYFANTLAIFTTIAAGCACVAINI